MVDRIGISRAECDHDSAHLVGSTRLLTIAQKLAILREVESQIAAFRRTLTETLDEMGLQRDTFLSWYRMRRHLESVYERTNPQVLNTPADANGNIREMVHRLMTEHDVFSREERDQLLQDIEAQSCGDDELLPLAIEEAGISRAVYEAWRVEREERTATTRRQDAASSSDRPPPTADIEAAKKRPEAVAFAERNLATLRCCISTPSQPEQRLRILACIQSDDQRRRKSWQRAFGIGERNDHEVMYRAWLLTKERDASILRKEWCVPLGTPDRSFKAVPHVESIIQRGQRPSDVLDASRIHELLATIRDMARRRLESRGLPDGMYEHWMTLPRSSISIAVDTGIQHAQPVPCPHPKLEGVTVHRPLTFQEANQLLREIDAAARTTLREHFLDETNFGAWVRYQQKQGISGSQSALPESRICGPQGDGNAAVLDGDELWVLFAKDRTNEGLRNRLLERYLAVVEYQARKLYAHLPEGVELDDLVSAGVFGLMGALQGFDLSRGVKFETYCVPRIRGAMLDELREMDWVPRDVRGTATKMRNFISQVQLRLGREPTTEELANEANVSVEKMETMLRKAEPPVVMSLEKKLCETDSFKEVFEKDFLVDPKMKAPAALVESREFLTTAFAYAACGLPPVMRQAFRLYYIENYSMKQIASALDVCESRISQLHKQYYPEFARRAHARLTLNDPRFPGERVERIAPPPLEEYLSHGPMACPS